MARIRVAIAAGDPALIRLVGDALPRKKFQVFGVAHVSEAIVLLRKHVVPVVVSDAALVGGVGVDLLRALALGPKRHAGLRFLLHQAGDIIPARGENNVLLYHDVLPTDPVDIIRRGIAAWLIDPRRSPDPRTIMGHPGRIRGAIDPAVAEPMTAANPTEGPGLRVDIRAFLEELRDRSERHTTQNYWEILGIPQDAPRHVLVKAFDDVSLRFHPDRNTAIRSPEVRQVVNRVYALMCEAYEILNDPDKADFYRKLVGAGRLRFDQTAWQKEVSSLVSLSRMPGARRYLEHADAAMASGDMRMAAMNLKLALKVDPDNPDLNELLEQTRGH